MGPHAGDLLAEVTLVIKLGCTQQHLAETIHENPTHRSPIRRFLELMDTMLRVDFRDFRMFATFEAFAGLVVLSARRPLRKVYLAF